MEIFGNRVSRKAENKAIKRQKKFIKKFGDDRNKEYHLGLEDNSVITSHFGAKNIVIADEKNLVMPEKPIIIGNIRMGFGHYRISMAMASAAHRLGYTPLWLDLNSFPQTTCTKIISYQNYLYSKGSRLSQKCSLFNKIVWEPLNYNGFKRLSYNVGDQKNAELMTPIFREIQKDTPFIATHVWPAQAAIHAGMKHVVNAIPDNWPMALHLAEGALHTVQTYNCYFGYKTLHGFDGKKILKPMADKDIIYTGHYVDDELVQNIEEDCEKRCDRATNKKPLRFLLTIGGAGAQGDFFAKIIKSLIPYVKQEKACIYLNCGDHLDVWENMKKRIIELGGQELLHPHFDNWKEQIDFADKAISNTDDFSSGGIHVFFNNDIFAAVYITNLLMRATDILVTKPSELSFYPVPKLFIKRIGGHEMWGAIHSVEIGDGTQECETPEYACFMIDLIMKNHSIIVDICCNILKNKKMGIYDGSYNAVKSAVNMTK